MVCYVRQVDNECYGLHIITSHEISTLNFYFYSVNTNTSTLHNFQFLFHACITIITFSCTFVKLMSM